jgi:CRP-like cAMP-binding protein
VSRDLYVGAGDFEDLSDRARTFAERHSRLVTLPGNSVVYLQDDPTEHVYFVRRGHVRLCYITEDGMVTLHSIVPAGCSFGEAGAFEGFSHCDSAFTAGETELMVLSLNWVSDNSPEALEMRHAISRMVARRYRDHVEFTRALYLPNLALRLSHTLLRLMDQLGNEINYRGRMVGCLGPVVTQRDLGSMARGTRENVNKALRRWARDGLLAMEDRHIIVLDRTRLEDLAVPGGD